jgi:hypothetical protein
MNTMTQPRHAVSSSNLESSFEGPKGSQPKPGLGQLWLAILALVAIVALAVAVAVGAVGNSESKDISTKALDPRADADFHRSAAAGSAFDSISVTDARSDADFHRGAIAAPAPVAPAAHPQAYEELVGGAAVSSATHPQAWEERTSSAVVDPRMDSDVHRQAPQASESAAPQAPATPHYVNGGLDPETQLAIYNQVTKSNTDPRQDADHHREAGQ